MNDLLRFFNNLANGLLSLVYPALCEGCNKPLTHTEEVLCIGCEHILTGTPALITDNNEAELRLAGRLPFAHGAAFATFTEDSLLQHLVHGLKYRNKKKNGIYLGHIWGRELKNAPWISEIDAITVVPLHKKKEQKRGYNQSVLIARGIAEATGIPLYTDIIERVRNTESQTKKSRTERIKNMADAFTLSSNCPLKEGHILLCDDVLTTGATLESCAKTLLAAGHYKVSFTTIGIA